MNHAAEAAGLLAQLTAVGTPERAEGEKEYLKSELTFVGSTVPATRAAVRVWLRARPTIGNELRELYDRRKVSG